MSDKPNPTFVKPTPPPLAHTVRACQAPKPAPRLPFNRIFRPPIDITIPWTDKPSPINSIIREYKVLFPNAGHPSSHDLIEWLYNRAVDAESNLKLYERDEMSDHERDNLIEQVGRSGI